MMDQRIQRYVDEGGWQEVFGACDPTAFAVLQDLDNIQKSHGIVGDLAEIGVAGGRFLIMLGLLAQAEEGVLAIDVFEVDHNYDTSGAATNLPMVQRNYQRFVGEDAELLTIAGDSMRLTPERFRTRSKTGQARLFSVDGAHSHFHTSSDMILAGEVLASGGVVMVDDITNAGWPGVMEGVGRYFLNSVNCKLFPFMMVYNKLWLTTYDYHQTYLNYALHHAPMFHQGMMKRVTRFYGIDVVGF